jgi:hypothetical protein
MTNPADIAHVISLSVAPVFLIAGIGGLLNVLIARLGRIVDRSRTVEQLFADAPEGEDRERHRVELLSTERRMRRINIAVSLCTLAALLICVVIMLLFAGQLVTLDVSPIIAALFVAAMAALIFALGFFLSEISVSIRSLRVRMEFLGLSAKALRARARSRDRDSGREAHP